MGFHHQVRVTAGGEHLVRLVDYLPGRLEGVEVGWERERQSQHVGHTPPDHEVQFQLLEDGFVGRPGQGGDGRGRTVDADHDGTTALGH